MALMNTEVIDKINDQIEGVIAYADNITELINEEIVILQGRAQDFVNQKANELSEKISEKGNDIRDKIVSIFQAQYQTALEKLKPIQELLALLPPKPDLGQIVDLLTVVVDVLIAPYQPIIEFTTEVIPKVLELSANLQKLVSYRPAINLPEGIEMPSLKIEIEPITAADITGGGSNDN